MKGLLSLLTLNFIPRSPDLGLLILRVALGIGMLVLYGWDKWVHFGKFAESFGDPLHIGRKMSLGLAVFAEVICSALLVIGFGTRFAALVLAFTMGVAFFMVRKGSLSGPGEVVALYLLGYVILLVAGPGRFSFDGGGGGGGGAKPH